MNEQDILEDLKKRVKPYQGIMEQGNYSNMLIRYRVGLVKPKTIECFFNKLGYVKEDGVWFKTYIEVLK